MVLFLMVIAASTTVAVVAVTVVVKVVARWPWLGGSGLVAVDVNWWLWLDG